MPVGAIIGGVASIGGAILGSKAQKKAANTAAQTATDNTAANNALAREIYGENKATLSPFVNSGLRAGGAINALLGLGGPAPQVGQANALGRDFGEGLPGIISGYGGGTWNADGSMATPINRYMAPGNNMGHSGGMWNGELIDGLTYSDGNQYAPQPQYAAGNVTTQAAPQSSQQEYENAFANYRNSTGYQFRVGEGGRALDNSYASRGVGQSGAAAKAALNYGQNIASGEFGNYLNALMAQQGTGLSAAGAQAGVSTNFVNQTTANNNSGASALANAAIAKGNATGNMWQGIAGGIGGIFGSSFG